MDRNLIQHKELAESGRWQELPFAQQMANIGSEVFRAGKWRMKGKTDRCLSASDRALELLDFTVECKERSSQGRRELLRLREILCDYFYGENQFHSSPEILNKYFDPFSLKASRQRSDY